MAEILTLRSSSYSIKLPSKLLLIPPPISALVFILPPDPEPAGFKEVLSITPYSIALTVGSLFVTQLSGT